MYIEFAKLENAGFRVTPTSHGVAIEGNGPLPRELISGLQALNLSDMHAQQVCDLAVNLQIIEVITKE